MTTSTINTRSLFWMLAGLNLLWAPVNVLVKIAGEHGLSGVALGQVRWTTHVILLGLLLATVAPFRKLTGAKMPPAKSAIWAMVIGALLFAPAHILYYTSMKLTTSIDGTVLLTTAPLWTTLLSFVVLKETITKRRVWALVLAMSGAYVVSYGFKAPNLTSNAVGNLMFFSGVFIECLGGAFATKLARESSGIAILWFQLLGAVPVMWLAPSVVPSLEVVRTPDMVAIGTLVYLVVVCGLITFSAWYVLVERAPLSLMVLALPVQPPISAFLAYLNNEPLRLEMLWGTVIIVLALVVGFGERGKKKTGEEEHPSPVPEPAGPA